MSEPRTLRITDRLELPFAEVEWTATRAQGTGGQNVNKTSTAVHLRFDARASSLPPDVRERLLALRDQRITREGVVVIKAQQHRSQDQNLEDALTRLTELLARAAHVPRKRKATKPTRSSQRKRLDSKTKHSRLKASRRELGD